MYDSSGSDDSEEETQEDEKEKNTDVKMSTTTEEESKHSEMPKPEEVPIEGQKETQEPEKTEVEPKEEPPKLSEPTCPGNSASSPAEFESMEISTKESPAEDDSGDWVRDAYIINYPLCFKEHFFDLWWPGAFVDKFKCLGFQLSI